MKHILVAATLLSLASAHARENGAISHNLPKTADEYQAALDRMLTAPGIFKSDFACRAALAAVPLPAGAYGERNTEPFLAPRIYSTYPSLSYIYAVGREGGYALVDGRGKLISSRLKVVKDGPWKKAVKGILNIGQNDDQLNELENVSDLDVLKPLQTTTEANLKAVVDREALDLAAAKPLDWSSFRFATIDREWSKEQEQEFRELLTARSNAKRGHGVLSNAQHEKYMNYMMQLGSQAAPAVVAFTRYDDFWAKAENVDRALATIDSACSNVDGKELKTFKSAVRAFQASSQAPLTLTAKK